MIRGTTPTLTFTLPFSTSIIDTFMLTFTQSGNEIFTLTEKDCELEEELVVVKLNQSQTLKFTNTSFVEIQMRVLTLDGVAIASNIIKCSVDKILKDGEIK
jgi:hypothetical protein